MTKKITANILGIVHGNFRFADDHSGGIKARY